jgi:hypothetical protein
MRIAGTDTTLLTLYVTVGAVKIGLGDTSGTHALLEVVKIGMGNIPNTVAPVEVERIGLGNIQYLTQLHQLEWRG